MLVERTAERSPVCLVHVGVGLAHRLEMSQAEPAVVDPAARALDVEASIDPDARCGAARTELAADALEIPLQSFVVWITAGLALLASLSEVILRLAGGAVDGEALWADDFAHAFNDGEVLVAVVSGAVDEIVGILLALSLDGVLEERSEHKW